MLVFQESPEVQFGGNTFINVPVVLQYGDEPLVEIIKQVDASFTTQISIFHPDGTYLAKAKGTQLYSTEAGKKAGIVMSHHDHVTACELAGQTLFEIRREGATALKGTAELYTPDGTFIKATESVEHYVLDNLNGDRIQIGRCCVTSSIFVDVSVGIRIDPYRPGKPR